MSNHLLVRAARGEAVERPPVWAMRQAGRWDPEFNRIRAGLSFYEFSENVELAARASLCTLAPTMPVGRPSSRCCWPSW